MLTLSITLSLLFLPSFLFPFFPTFLAPYSTLSYYTTFPSSFHFLLTIGFSLQLLYPSPSYSFYLSFLDFLLSFLFPLLSIFTLSIHYPPHPFYLSLTIFTISILSLSTTHFPLPSFSWNYSFLKLLLTPFFPSTSSTPFPLLSSYFYSLTHSITFLSFPFLSTSFSSPLLFFSLLLPFFPTSFSPSSFSIPLQIFLSLYFLFAFPTSFLLPLILSFLPLSS